MKMRKEKAAEKEMSLNKMDEKEYEKRLRRILCAVFAVEILILIFINIDLDYIFLEEFIGYSAVIFVVLILECLFVAFFKVFETFKMAVLFCLIAGLANDIVYYVKTGEKYYLSNLFRFILIIVMGMIPITVYNMMMIRYHKQNHTANEKDEYRKQLSRKICIIPCLQQIGSLIVIFATEDTYYWNLHFHMRTYEAMIFVVCLAAVMIFSAIIIVLEWKYNELFEFIEFGKHILSIIITPIVLVVISGTPNNYYNVKAAIAFVCITSFLPYFIYKRCMKKYSKTEEKTSESR